MCAAADAATPCPAGGWGDDQRELLISQLRAELSTEHGAVPFSDDYLWSILNVPNRTRAYARDAKIGNALVRCLLHRHLHA